MAAYVYEKYYRNSSNLLTCDMSAHLLIKAKTEDKIYKPDREEIIIKKQTEGMKPELVREYTALIKRIMEVSRKYQYGRT